MGGLLSKLAGLIVYLCVGTLIAQGICVSYAISKGYLTKSKLLEMVALARQTDSGKQQAANAEKKEQTSEQPSLEDIENARALRMRNLELREQAVQAVLDQVRYEQSKLLDEKDTYLRTRAAFDAHLENMKEGAIAKGRTDARTILESVKPKQAKEQILKMVEAGEQKEVVAILSEMPVPKRAKICAEFSKTDEEKEILDELLRLIRQGDPDVSPIKATQEELKATQPQAN